MLLEKVEAGFETVGELYSACKVRSALGEALALPLLAGVPSHKALTYDHTGAIGTHSLRSVQTWAKSAMPAGQTLHQPAPFFKKLDESVIEEYARLER